MSVIITDLHSQGLGNRTSFIEALQNQYLIRNYTVEDGLPINSINSITHHSDGYIYMATNDGLARFDGAHFTTYNTFNSPELQSNRFKAVQSGHGNDLFFFDFVSRLYLLRNGSITCINKTYDLSGAVIQKIYKLENGSYLLDTDQGMFRLLKDGQLQIVDHPETKSSFFNSYNFDGKTTGFINSNGWFELVNDEVKKRLPISELLINPEDIFHITADETGTFWFLTYSGKVLEISASNKQKLYQYEDEVNLWGTIKVDPHTLIISSEIGYLQLDTRTERITKTPYTSESEGYFVNEAWNDGRLLTLKKFQNSIFIDDKLILEQNVHTPFITTDKEGSIWIATNGKGVFQISKKIMVSVSDDILPNITNTYGLAAYKNDIWITSFEGGITRIGNTSIDQWTNSNSGLSYKYHRSIAVIDEHHAVAGSFNLWNYTNGHWSRDPHFNEDSYLIDAIFYDSNSHLWIGSEGGLFIKSDSTYAQYFDQSDSTIYGINSIVESKNGALFFPTSETGLAILDSTNVFRFITTDEGLSSNRIRDVHVEVDTLWVVTEDYGLNRVILDKNNAIKSVRTLTVSDGLIDNSLHRLIADEFGFFWINSNKGIMRIQKEELNNYLSGTKASLNLSSFQQKDGLTNIEGNGGTQRAGILTSHGDLFFPNQDGLVYTRPEWHVALDQLPLPNPIIEKFSFSDTTISVANEPSIRLPKEARSVRAQLTLPTFRNPEKIQLEYRLKGVTNGWEKTDTDRFAVFNNLSAGTYILEVRGRIKGSSRFFETQLPLSIAPFFYETTWFYIVLSLFFFALVYAGGKGLLYRAKKREEKLENIVQERTAELQIEKEKTEEALVTIKKLDESKTQFFANFTHELRTPLSLILSPLEDMLENSSNSNKEDSQPVAMMMRNAYRLKQLVNQLLDVSKLNSGQLKLTFEKVDLCSATDQFIVQFEHALEQKEITLVRDFPKTTGPIYIDIAGWEHICTNLLSNAIKFTPAKGKITLTISETSDHIEIQFADTGSGIESSDLPFIFDPYYQGDSTNSKAGGTGIGLAIVKGMVEKMGGEIEVTSKIDEGTKFKIRLQKGLRHIDSAHKILSGPSGYFDNMQTFPNQKEVSNQNFEVSNSEKSASRILIVEDNEDFRIYLHSLINPFYHVNVAKNGSEGLDMIDQFKPDLIVSDVMMPEMNGFEMMTKIREKNEFKNIPFIFLTARDSEDDIQHGLNLGADIYLTKPVQNRLLLTQIRALLKREQEILEYKNQVTILKVSSLVSDTIEIIHRHMGNPDLSVNLIAESLSMSPTSLYRRWRDEHKEPETINQLITKLRLENALNLMHEENLSISEASYAVGYKHYSHFSRSFKKMYGVSPREYLDN